MPNVITLTVVHRLNHRIRMRLSHPFKQVERMKELVKKHPGIREIGYTSVTQSVLVTFDSNEIAVEEILVRVGLSISRDYGIIPVRVLAEPERHELTDSSLYSGALIMAAMFNRVFGGDRRRADVFDWTAGVGTAAAVIEHGWQEVSRRGNFDPEVLSVVYLLSAFLRGNFFTASIVTWATTFGRHLVKLPPTGVMMKPYQVLGSEEEEPQFKVEVVPDTHSREKTAMLTLLPSAVMNALRGRDEPGGGMIEEIRNVSHLHDEVLEGLGDLRQGIPLKVYS